MAEEKPEWLKKALGAFETVKEKIAPKQETEPNYGKNTPDVLNQIDERARGSVIHISEVGRFKVENEGLVAYAVVLKRDSQFPRSISFDTLIAFLTTNGIFRYAFGKECREVNNDERMKRALFDELGWASKEFLEYREFATKKPWMRFNLQQFKEFKAEKAMIKKTATK